PFRARAVQRLVTPELDVNGNPKRNKIIHVNINLESTDPSARRSRDREVEFTRHQFTAFESLSVNGQVELLVDTEVELESEDVDVDDENQKLDEPSGTLRDSKLLDQDSKVEDNSNVDGEDDNDVSNIDFFDDDGGGVKEQQQPKKVEDAKPP